MTAYVISIPGAAVRLERTAKEFASFCPDIKWSVPEVCDAGNLSEREFSALYDCESARRRYRRDLCRGEIGCTLSHLSAMKAFLSTDERCCLVVEDDVLFSPDIGQFLKDVGENIPLGKPIAVVLSQAAKVRYWTARRWFGDFSRTSPIEIYGTVCYVVNRLAAELMLRVNSVPVSLQADCWNVYREHGLKFWGVCPVLAGSFDYDRKESSLSCERKKAFEARVSIGLPQRRLSFGRRLIGYVKWKAALFFEKVTFVDCSGSGSGRTNAAVYKVNERKDSADAK